jgi:hypothetical protein
VLQQVITVVMYLTGFIELYLPSRSSSTRRDEYRVREFIMHRRTLVTSTVHRSSIHGIHNDFVSSP